MEFQLEPLERNVSVAVVGKRGRWRSRPERRHLRCKRSDFMRPNS